MTTTPDSTPAGRLSPEAADMVRQVNEPARCGDSHPHAAHMFNRSHPGETIGNRDRCPGKGVPAEMVRALAADPVPPDSTPACAVCHASSVDCEAVPNGNCCESCRATAGCTHSPPPPDSTPAETERTEAVSVALHHFAGRDPDEQWTADQIVHYLIDLSESEPAARPATVSDEAVEVAHEVLMNSVLRIRFEGATTREVTRDALVAAWALTAQPEAEVRADEWKRRCTWCRIGQHAHCESPELLPCTCGHAETTKDAVSRGETMAEVLDRYAEGSVEQRWVVDDVRAAIARTAPAGGGDHG